VSSKCVYLSLSSWSKEGDGVLTKSNPFSVAMLAYQQGALSSDCNRDYAASYSLIEKLLLTYEFDEN
jgi:hypothetical protein